jgi:hypothetical protein
MSKEPDTLADIVTIAADVALDGQIVGAFDAMASLIDHTDAESN